MAEIAPIEAMAISASGSCDQPTPTIHCRSLAGFLGKRYVYFCALCHKVLGVSHRKGFFMG